MAERSQPPWSPLPRQVLDRALASAALLPLDLALLRWMVWLSLLSVQELRRIVRVDGEEVDDKTLRAHLLQLERNGLAASVALYETGYPRGEHRYHITDLGLYVLVGHFPTPLSVSKLIACYPVTRLDLLARLTRPFVHLVLSELVSRLIAESPAGYLLTSYQQPWKQTYPARLSGTARKQTWSCDAAFLLRVPGGTQHAFYVLVDQPESLFFQREARQWLSRLFALRQSLLLQGEVMPNLLLLAPPARFPFWAGQLEQLVLQWNTPAPDGGITDPTRLACGAWAPIWLPLRDLILSGGHDLQDGHTSLLAWLDRPSSAELVELFSQYFTFQHLADVSPKRSARQLSRYVGEALQEEVIHELRPAEPTERIAVPAMLAEELYGERVARLRITAVLNLLLNGQQKAILAHLVRHPHASLPDLLAQLHPNSRDDRLVSRQLDPLLIEFKLVQRDPWQQGSGWRERERYRLSETGLRFMAMRHGLSPAYYLMPGEQKVRGEQPKRVSPLDTTVRWEQRWAALLHWQMPHTNGLYRCIRCIIQAGHRSGTYRVLSWKSAREAIRRYYDAEEGRWMNARPDAELLYVRAGSSRIECVLIEYDRGTTHGREYEGKFTAYSHYQRATRSTLPLLLVVMHRPEAARKIRQAIQEVGAADVPVALVPETDLLQHGLCVLEHLSP